MLIGLRAQLSFRPCAEWRAVSKRCQVEEESCARTADQYMQWQESKLDVLQADKMSGAPAASAAPAAGKKGEEAAEGDGKDSSKPQPKGGAWWQWLLVKTVSVSVMVDT